MKSSLHLLKLLHDFSMFTGRLIDVEGSIISIDRLFISAGLSIWRDLRWHQGGPQMSQVLHDTSVLHMKMSQWFMWRWTVNGVVNQVIRYVIESRIIWRPKLPQTLSLRVSWGLPILFIQTHVVCCASVSIICNWLLGRKEKSLAWRKTLIVLNIFSDAEH